VKRKKKIVQVKAHPRAMPKKRKAKATKATSKKSKGKRQGRLF
jgi:hypothetical protein